MKKLKLKEENIKEALLLGGFVSLEIGVWLIYPPAAFIIGGAILLWLGLPSKEEG